MRHRDFRFSRKDLDGVSPWGAHTSRMSDESSEASEREDIWRQLQVKRARLVSVFKTTKKQRHAATRFYSDLIEPIIERMRLERGETGVELEALMPQIRQRAGAEAKQKGGPALENFEAEEKAFASYAPRLDSLLEQLSLLDKDLDGAANLSTVKLRELAARHGIILGERPG